jgi:hypothetical protein
VARRRNDWPSAAIWKPVASGSPSSSNFRRRKAADAIVITLAFAFFWGRAPGDYLVQEDPARFESVVRFEPENAGQLVALARRFAVRRCRQTS